MIDNLYIIHLYNNGRFEKLLEQCLKYNICSKITIVVNYGFKGGKKDKYIDNSVKDLIDAYLNIFDDALKNNYGNVMIFEDDFEICEESFNKTNCEKIINFCKGLGDTSYQYYLGCLPYLSKKINEDHREIIIGSFTHSVIYSKKCIETISTSKLKNIRDWDLSTILFSRKYTFYLPLVTQKIIKTENRSNWSNWMICGTLMSKPFGDIIENEMNEKSGFENFLKLYKKFIVL